jgi:hypothetical protein
MRRFVVLLHKVQARNDQGLCVLSGGTKAFTRIFHTDDQRDERMTEAHLAFTDISDACDEFPCSWISLEEQCWLPKEETWEGQTVIAVFDCRTKQRLSDGERASAFYSPE